MKLNKKGSMSLALVLFVMVMLCGYSWVTIGTATSANMLRHQKQIENIYTYTSVSEMVSDTVLNQLGGYSVQLGRNSLQGIETYRTLTSNLAGTFADGNGDYRLFTEQELVTLSMPTAGEPAKFMSDIVSKANFSISVNLRNLFIPDFASDDNKLDFATGDHFNVEAFTIGVTVKDKSTKVYKEFEVRNVRCDVAMTNDTITLRPVFSDAVMRDVVFLCE